MRSNKWAINPTKLQQFLWQELSFSEAESYAQQIVGEEIPHALKHHFKSVILPRLHLQSNGISLLTIHHVVADDSSLRQAKDVELKGM
jgi:hypothetical protein